jgi:hypothetical protein
MDMLTEIPVCPLLRRAPSKLTNHRRKVSTRNSCREIITSAEVRFKVPRFAPVFNVDSAPVFTNKANSISFAHKHPRILAIAVGAMVFVDYQMIWERIACLACA